RQMAVQVDLGESPVSGITARMLLPAEIMADRPETPSDSDARRSRTPEQSPAARSIAASQPEPAYTAPRVAPIEPVPQQPQPVPTVRMDTPMHRWPTDDESLPPEPVTVAALANSAPYHPATATANHQPGPASAERTRNGLVKRQPRHRGATTTIRPAPTTPTQPRHTADESTERTPTDVGTMLSAFRRGHKLGESNGRHAGGDEPSHVVQEEPGEH
ncbi:MAG TPA: hypothetical protein VF892_01430, partial [Pseudonocardiaceae bacterium]